MSTARHRTTYVRIIIRIEHTVHTANVGCWQEGTPQPSCLAFNSPPTRTSPPSSAASHIPTPAVANNMLRASLNALAPLAAATRLQGAPWATAACRRMSAMTFVATDKAPAAIGWVDRGGSHLGRPHDRFFGCMGVGVGMSVDAVWMWMWCGCVCGVCV